MVQMEYVSKHWIVDKDSMLAEKLGKNAAIVVMKLALVLKPESVLRCWVGPS